jgi:hypothetical protein
MNHRKQYILIALTGLCLVTPQSYAMEFEKETMSVGIPVTVIRKLTKGQLRSHTFLQRLENQGYAVDRDNKQYSETHLLKIELPKRVTRTNKLFVTELLDEVLEKIYQMDPSGTYKAYLFNELSGKVINPKNEDGTDRWVPYGSVADRKGLIVQVYKLPFSWPTMPSIPEEGIEEGEESFQIITEL